MARSWARQPRSKPLGSRPGLAQALGRLLLGHDPPRLGITKAGVDRFADIDLIHQILPGRILREAIYEVVGSRLEGFGVGHGTLLG
jgi:hypothetical protein